MKKIFTLILGLVVALGVIAAPQAKQLKNAKISHKSELKIKDAQKRSPRKIKLDGEPSAVIDINCTNLNLEDFYGMMYILSASNEQYEVEAYLSPEEDVYTTYSSEAENISMYITDLSTDEDLSVSAEGELKKADDGSLTFVGTAIDENNRQFNLNFSYVLPEAKDTINLEFNEPISVLYYGESEDYYIVASNEQTGWTAILDIFTDEFEGSFTTEDFDDYYTYLVHIEGVDTTYFEMLAAQADIVTTDNGALLNVGILADDENFYQFNLTYIKPQAKDTVTVEILDAKLDESYLELYGFTALAGKTADESILLTIAVPGEFENGEFTSHDLYTGYSTVAVADDEFAFVDGTFKVTVADTLIRVEGSLLAQNEILYNFVLQQTIVPIVAKDTIRIDFKELGTQRYYSDTEDFYLVASNENYLITLDIFTDELPGTYETDDFDMRYTGLYKINGNDTTDYEILNVSAEIVATEQGGRVRTQFLASDSLFYIATFEYEIFQEADTVNITVSNGKLNDLISDMGAFQVLGISDDQNYTLSLVIESQQLDGEYTVENLIYQGEYTYIYNKNGSFLFVDGKISVKQDGTKLIVDAELTASNGVVYIIHFVADTTTALVNVEGINKLGNIQKVIENGNVYIIKDGVKYNTLGKIVE
jgi:hypothetical protein